MSSYVPSVKFPALNAASPVAFFWRATSSLVSVLSGSKDIDGVERGR
jgi:hypothetical protein